MVPNGDFLEMIVFEKNAITVTYEEFERRLAQLRLRWPFKKFQPVIESEAVHFSLKKKSIIH